MHNGNIPVKRRAKDSVFVHLFRDKRYVLQLYRALHPEAVDVTEDMIEIITLENVLTDHMYNDLGFLIGKSLIVLVEAQSTWTVNIIVRAFLYLAQTYHDYIGQEDLNIYGSRPIPLPAPELYVIYTGDRPVGKDTVTLSEEFFGGIGEGASGGTSGGAGGVKSDLEVTVHVLTDGERGDIIYQYVAFTKVLDAQTRQHGRTSEAIAETIRICKDRDLLKQYLTEHEQEVQDIMITLFDEETILKGYITDARANAREEGLAEGRAEGRKEGRAEGRAEGFEEGLEKGEKKGEQKGEQKKAVEVARKMLHESMPIDLIARISGLTDSEIHALQAAI